MDKEIRIIRKPIELRAVKGDDGGEVFTGYAFAWDTPSDDLGGFVEIIRRGATMQALRQEKNIFAILDHEKKVSNVLGDRDSGTLAMFEDDRGFGFTIKSGPTQAAKDAAIVAARNNIGVSFAFICGKQNWTTLPDGTRQREILEFRELDDLSLVVDAAYKSSDVSVAKRSLEELLEVERRSALELRGAIPFKATAKDDADKWDAKAAEKRVREWAGGDEIDYPKYQQAFAYKTGDGKTLGDYHLLHHDIKDGKLVVVWRGVTSAMAAVNGARGGVKWEIPADKEAVYNHLKKHYEQFDQDAPEMRSLGLVATPETDPMKLLQNLLALLRAQNWLHHTAHWQAGGPDAYQLHLLFERLYTALPEQYDALAEKMVAAYGPDSVDPKTIMVGSLQWLIEWTSGDPLATAIASENDLQAVIRLTYDALKSAGQLPTGLDDYLLALADDHDTHVYLLGQLVRPAATEPRNAKEPEKMEKKPSVDFLRRQLDQAELEIRCGIAVSESRDDKTHGRLTQQAHWATESALEAKRCTGAPSRALEMRAAEAHDAAAESAKNEKLPAAQKFHEAAAVMHRAASGDDYAKDFQHGWENRSAADKNAERRAGRHHDENGKFHDGSPESILSAAQGKLIKTEARHSAACEAYRAVVEKSCREHPDAVAARQKVGEARDAHQSAIEAADACLADVTALHAARIEEHRGMVEQSKVKLNELQAAVTTPTG